MFHGRKRGCAGATVVAGDQDDIGVCLRYSCSHRANAELRHKLHMNTRFGVRILEVMNKLGEIFDAVDVVMWRR